LSEKRRLVVLVSGSGTNLQAILDACEADELDARVVAVISDKAAAFGLERARKAGIPALHIPSEEGQTREDYDSHLAEVVLGMQPDLVVLAGWMRILSLVFLAHFPMQVINLHPALPGRFPGTHAIQRAFEAFRNGSIQQTGVMVHYVPDEGVDDGPVILKEVVSISDEDTLGSLEERIHKVEHSLLVNAIERVLSSKED
jgi:phosphoribosylglycinamide formyltransferase-1